jgi:hypothetical protein
MDLPAISAAQAQDRTSRVVVWVALVAVVYSAFIFGRTLTAEWDFFSTHTSQKTRILLLPAELAKTEREILREQENLLRIQAEIRSRMGQK